MKIFTLIPKIMAEVGAIEKTRRNSQGSGYMFRGIDDVYQALQAPLAKHGVFFAPNVTEHTREERESKSGGTLIYTILKVEFNFYADDGSTFKVTTLGEAMDSGDKSANKAMSAALKNACLQLFCVPTEEDKDTETASPDPKLKAKAIPAAPVTPLSPPAERSQPSTQQLGNLFAIVRKVGWSTEQFKAYLGVTYHLDSSRELSLEQYQQTLRDLQTVQPGPAVATLKTGGKSTPKPQARGA